MCWLDPSISLRPTHRPSHWLTHRPYMLEHKVVAAVSLSVYKVAIATVSSEVLLSSISHTYTHQA